MLGIVFVNSWVDCNVFFHCFSFFMFFLNFLLLFSLGSFGELFKLQVDLPGNNTSLVIWWSANGTVVGKALASRGFRATKSRTMDPSE